MTLNIAHLRERVAPRSPTLNNWTIRSFVTSERQDTGHSRCTTSTSRKTFQALKRPNKYQDRVIGSHYFEGRKSLQWSNYLYFITSRDRFASSKSDRLKS